MAAKFKTTMLRAGHTYHSGSAKVPVTRDRLKHWASEHARLRATGYAPPMHYDHSDEREMQTPITMDAIEHKKGRSAENSIGYLDQVKLNEAGDAAELTYKIIDDKVATQLDEGVVHLSPILLSKFQDGAKNQYADVIGHLDVVNYPVDYSQSSAERVAVAMGLPTTQESDVVAIKFESSGFAPMFRNDHAIAMGMEMGMKDMDGPKPDNEADGTGDDHQKTMPADDNSQESGIGEILTALSMMGLSLQADTDSSNLIERLKVALPVFVAANPLFEDGEMDSSGMMKGGDTFGNQNGERIVAEHEIATTMSLKTCESKAARYDAMLKAGDITADVHKELTEGLDAVKLSLTYGDDNYRNGQASQLDQMLKDGQMTPAEHSTQREALSTIKLSLVDGKPAPTSVSEFIKHREAVPKGAFWDGKRKTAETSNLSEADQPDPVKMSLNPDDETKEISDAEAAALVEKHLG